MGKDKMKLAIISHTPHYISRGKVVGWGPTVREINHLVKIFDEIYHIAPLHKEDAPGSSMEYTSEEIKYISLKPYGGKKLTEKFSIISTAFYNLRKVKKVIKEVDWVQFRAPTAMGLYILPYLSMRKKPHRWVKYAGNWKMNNPPFSYAIQKWWLRKNFQKSIVTINGHWEGQEAHILNFQNPCLDNEELMRAKKISDEKNFENKLTFCFVGTLTKNKGVDLIIRALKKIEDKGAISEVILCGDGPERIKYEEQASRINLKITFKGFLSRIELEKVYSVSHLILLPSESEGFPKVIAEASAYGCVPIVSDVSSISMYYNNENGFLLKKLNADELAENIKEAINDRKKLKEKSMRSAESAGVFTFENYIKNLKEKILSGNN